MSITAEKTNCLSVLNTKLEQIPGKGIEKFVLILYIISTSIISAFHEPWFDEAQSWMIARSASLFDIIFKIPHYEGHPPFWHLVLLPFARTGIPYEIGLKAASILICSIAVGLIIFCSPFPRIVRIILPFTYFYFYQYCVISRCYSLMMLGFILAAMTYQNKNEKPFRFILSLMLLCGSSAYGIIFSGGIAAVWVFEILKNKLTVSFINEFVRSRRLIALITLFIFAGFLILTLIPKENTYAMNLSEPVNSAAYRILYLFFVLPAESLLFKSYYTDNPLKFVNFPYTDFLAGTYIGMIIIFIIIIISRKYRKTLLFILPYSLFVIFSAFFYFSTHHIGIPALFLTFWSWVCYESFLCTRFQNSEKQPKIIGSGGQKISLKKFCLIMLAIVISVSIYWSSAAAINEIRNNYGAGRSIANFIKQYNLSEYSIMVSWQDNLNRNQKQEEINTYQTFGVEVLPYFDRNIFYNLNNGNDNEGYLLHYKAGKNDNNENFNQWRLNGLPDVMIGNCDLSSIFTEAELLKVDYIPIYEVDFSRIWKDDVFKGKDFIYMRKKYADELGLAEIQVSK